MKIHQGFKIQLSQKVFGLKTIQIHRNYVTAKTQWIQKGLETYTEMLNLLRKQIHVNKK